MQDRIGFFFYSGGVPPSFPTLPFKKKKKQTRKGRSNPLPPFFFRKKRKRSREGEEENGSAGDCWDSEVGLSHHITTQLPVRNRQIMTLFQTDTNFTLDRCFLVLPSDGEPQASSEPSPSGGRSRQQLSAAHNNPLGRVLRKLYPKTSRILRPKIFLKKSVHYGLKMNLGIKF